MDKPLKWTSKRALNDAAPSLFEAAYDLLIACRIADEQGELSDHVDGSYLDAVQAALNSAAENRE